MAASPLARILTGSRDATRPPRLLLAAKTALAVGIAWAIAPFMPGVTDEYPYYAPLGALVSMYPTLMGSAKTGLQTLLGLAAGIGLAALVIMTVGPTWWSIPLIVGVAVVFSGSGWFGAGREYVPMAALFVLIIGGQDADSYSIGYLVQMAVGVGVGLAVNLIIAPAVTSSAAGARVDGLRSQIAEQLDDIGSALRESWPPEHSAWSENTERLARTAESVGIALVEGAESRKGNPRALLHRRDVDRDHARLAMLATITFHVRDIAGALADTIWQRSGALTFDPELAAPLSDACRAVSAAIATSGDDDPESRRALAHAAAVVRHLVEAVETRSLEAGRALGPGVLTAINLRRIVVHLHEDGRADAEDDTEADTADH